MHRGGKHEAEELELVSPLPLLLGSDSSRDDSALCLHCARPGDLHFVLCGFQTGGFTLLLLQGSSDASSPKSSVCSLQSSVPPPPDGQWHFQGDSQGVPLSSAGLWCTPGYRSLDPSSVCGHTAPAPAVAVTLAEVRSAQGAAGTKCAQLPACCDSISPSGHSQYGEPRLSACSTGGESTWRSG